jgi:hypothetical protein
MRYIQLHIFVIRPCYPQQYRTPRRIAWNLRHSTSPKNLSSLWNFKQFSLLEIKGVIFFWIRYPACNKQNLIFLLANKKFNNWNYFKDFKYTTISRKTTAVLNGHRSCSWHANHVKFESCSFTAILDRGVRSLEFNIHRNFPQFIPVKNYFNWKYLHNFYALK